MGEEFESHIRLGDVTSDRQTGLKKQARLGRVSHFDTVNLNTDMARRLPDINPLDNKYHVGQLNMMIEFAPCKGPSGGCGFPHPLLAKRPPCRMLS